MGLNTSGCTDLSATVILKQFPNCFTLHVIHATPLLTATCCVTLRNCHLSPGHA
jgi:hypothetical protein